MSESVIDVDDLISGCEELERYIGMDAKIAWQDGQWHLFRHDGEGLFTGLSVAELILNMAR